MAGIRIILAVFAVALAAQAVAYAWNLAVLHAWPGPLVWFAALVAAVAVTITAAINPTPATMTTAGVTTGSLYALRIVELGHALMWGRLSVATDAARATGWLALTRDLSALVALFGMWAGMIVLAEERDAHVARCERPSRSGGARGALARAVRRDRHRDHHDAYRAHVDCA